MRRIRLLAVGLCLALLVGACGDDDSSDNSSGDTKKEVTFDGEVVIGTSQPLTGSFGGGSGDNPLVTGFEQAVADINEKGGVTVDGKRMKIKLVMRDNKSDANVMAQQVRSIALEDKAVAQIGPPSLFGFQAIPIVNSMKIPTVMAGLPVDLFPSGKGGYWYASYLQSKDIAPQFLEFVGKHPIAKKVVVIANNDPTSTGFAKGFTAASKAAGFETVAEAMVPPGTTDFSKVIGEAKSKGAEIVSVQLSPADCPALLKQMKALDYKPKVFSAALCGLVPSWPNQGPLADGAIAALVWHPDIPGLPDAKRLQEAFAKAPNNVSRMASVTGYQAVQILVDAINRAGSTDGEKINAALAATDGNFVLGPVKFDADHKSVVKTYQGQWQGSDIVPVYPESVAGSHKFVYPYPGLK